jgi:hypothetical protein
MSSETLLDTMDALDEWLDAYAASIGVQFVGDSMETLGWINLGTSDRLQILKAAGFKQNLVRWTNTEWPDFTREQRKRLLAVDWRAVLAGAEA